jgi:hypothetical protein
MLDPLPQWPSVSATPMAAEGQPLNAPSGSLKEMFSGSFMGGSRRVLEAKIGLQTGHRDKETLVLIERPGA